MMQHCAVPLQLFLPLLLGLLLPLLILSAASSHGDNINDAVSPNVDTRPEGDRHWIVQRGAVQRQRRQGRRKVKLEKRIKKWKEAKSCKGKSKSKQQEGGRKRRKNSIGEKQEKYRKKGKKGKKNNRSGKTLDQGAERQSDNGAACMTKLILYSRLNEKKASAISKQVKRIKGNDKIQKSKWNKKSNFDSTKERLLSALGGDASNPTCGGKAFNSTLFNSTSNSAFSKDTLTTLLACEADIAEECGNRITEDTSKLAELEACERLANNFKSEFSKCFDKTKTVDESCICVEAISESNVTRMQDCDVSSDNDAALKRKRACKAAVGKCKTAEAAAVEGIDTCKRGSFFPPATTSPATTSPATTGHVKCFSFSRSIYSPPDKFI